MIGDFEFGLKTAIKYKVNAHASGFYLSGEDMGIRKWQKGMDENLYPSLSLALLREQFAGLFQRSVDGGRKERHHEKDFQGEQIAQMQSFFIKKILLLKK